MQDEPPPLPTPAPGHSALPAFLEVEQWLRARSERRLAETGGLEASIREEADRIRTEGEARLKEVVRQAQQDALRAAETRANARESQARKDVQAWIEASEAELAKLADEILEEWVGAAPEGALPAPAPARPDPLPRVDLPDRSMEERPEAKPLTDRGAPRGVDLDAVLRSMGVEDLDGPGGDLDGPGGDESVEGEPVPRDDAGQEG